MLGHLAAAVTVSLGLVMPQLSPVVSILDPADAKELADLLAEATTVQDICYGWHVEVIDEDGSTGSGSDIGSSSGVGKDAVGACPRWMVFTATLHYTAATSESADQATFDITSNIEGAPLADDLRAVGISGTRLLSNDDDLAIIDATSALPLLAAERGLAPPVPLEPNADPLPEGDRATGRPGSDWARTHGPALWVGGILLVLALGWAALAALHPRWMHDLWEAAKDAD